LDFLFDSLSLLYSLYTLSPLLLFFPSHLHLSLSSSLITFSSPPLDVAQRGSPVRHRPVCRLCTNGSFLPSQRVSHSAQCAGLASFALVLAISFPVSPLPRGDSNQIRVFCLLLHAGCSSFPSPLLATPCGLASCAMRKSSYTDPRDSLDTTDTPSFTQPISPLSVNTSAPDSPAISLFSATGHGHNRVSSSVSSLVSSGGLGNSMDSPSRSHLTGVKEEECARDSLEDQYFRTFLSTLLNAFQIFPTCDDSKEIQLIPHLEHFECSMSTPADDSYFPMNPSDSYDLTDSGMDLPTREKRVSDSMSIKGVSRIGSHISTMSTRWKSRRTSGSPEREVHPDDLRSRANSAASSALASPIVSPISRIDSIPPSPARTIFEERINESGAQPIDIVHANSLSQDDNDTQQATTPLLPPFMGDDPTSAVASRVQSPLQSPSVADVSEISHRCSLNSSSRIAGMGIPSPPLSSKPSLASMSRPRASTSRTVSGDASPAPFTLSSPSDEWANKLGHANFTIVPEPYSPETRDMESFHQLRADWDMARCNFAKHLVRTGEHYGVTSNIYKLTVSKWDSINLAWKSTHEALLTDLGAEDRVALTLTQNPSPAESVRIPRLHDNKFPEMGDEDIVGPMTVAPAGETGLGSCGAKSMKKNFFRFFQDLVSRT